MKTKQFHSELVGENDNVKSSVGVDNEIAQSKAGKYLIATQTLMSHSVYHGNMSPLNAIFHFHFSSFELDSWLRVHPQVK